MAKTIGTAIINLEAGTAKFVRDLEKAKGKVRDFGSQGGRAMREFGAHTASSTQAASAAIRTFEGSLPIRAVERFLAVNLKLGPILQNAFPIIGAVALGETLFRVGKGVTDFYRDVSQMSSKISAAFRDLNQPLRLTNDELLVTNTRLANDIAKLEGKRQNTLALALNEARAAADKLAESLEKDLKALDAVFKENGIGFFKGLVTGKADTGDIEDAVKKFQRAQQEFDDSSARRLDTAIAGDLAAKDPKKNRTTQAQSEIDSGQLSLYQNQIYEMEALFQKTRDAQAAYVKSSKNPIYDITTRQTGATPEVSNRDQSDRLGVLQAIIDRYRGEMTSISLKNSQRDMTATKQGLEGNAANAKLDKPFENAIAKLEEELESARVKTLAAGWGESAKVVTEAYGKTLDVIRQVNREMERGKLTSAQEGQIGSKEQAIARSLAEGEWQKKLKATTDQIRDQISAQQRLTEAIGKGYEAAKRANVETRLMSPEGVGAERYNDRKWMDDHAPDVAKLRAGFGAEFDAQRTKTSAEATSNLRTQIEMEKNLAAVQIQGAEAIRRVTLAYRLRALSATATREQIKAEIDLYEATRATERAADIEKINQRVEAIRRLTAGYAAGAEAVRRLTLENQIAEATREKGPDTAAPGMIGVGQRELAMRSEEESIHQEQIAKSVGEQVNLYADKLRKLDEEEAYLKANVGQYRDMADVNRTLKDLENQRLEVEKEQLLAIGKASDGLKAFFLEMQQEGEKTGKVIYDALNEAVDGVSDNLTKALTGQKTSWGKMFQDIGQQMLKSSIKSGLQQGLGEIGKLTGIKGLDKLAGGGKPDGSPANPIWVKIAGATGIPDWHTIGGGSSGSGGGMRGLGPIFGGSQGGGIFNFSGGGSAASGMPGSSAGGANLPDATMALAGASALTFHSVPLKQKQSKLSTIFSDVGAGVTMAANLYKGYQSLKAMNVANGMGSGWLPGRASGGDVTAGDAFRVGEGGPETFVPRVSGTILNNAQTRRLAGGDTHVHYNVDARGSSMTPEQFKAALRATHEASVTKAVQAVHEAHHRSPHFGR